MRDVHTGTVLLLGTIEFPMDSRGGSISFAVKISSQVQYGSSRRLSWGSWLSRIEPPWWGSLRPLP